MRILRNYKVQYDTDHYDFREMVQDHLRVQDLTLVHEIVGIKERAQRARPGNDQHTTAHRRLYRIGEDFMCKYRSFVKNVAAPIVVSGSYLYQRIPTFRIHMPRNKAVGGDWHRDTDYNHPQGEVNFLVTLTRARDSNTIHIESSSGLGDFNPVDLDYGEMLIFDGGSCRHGNVTNTTGLTRVSFDFRILPDENVSEHTSGKSVCKGIEFAEGGYYAR